MEKIKIEDSIKMSSDEAEAKLKALEDSFELYKKECGKLNGLCDAYELTAKRSSDLVKHYQEIFKSLHDIINQTNVFSIAKSFNKIKEIVCSVNLID